MRRAVIQVLVGAMAVWCLAPFVWQVDTSLKTDAEITAVPTVYLPHEPHLGHYRALFERKPFARYLVNSVVVSGTSTALCVGIGAMAAYSIARLKFRGGRYVLIALVLVSLFPPILFLFPLYELVRLAGLANNPVALIVPYVTFNLPFAVLVLSTFFEGVPMDIEEAAKVDGFSRTQVLLRVIAPLSAPALATTAILVFISCWNEFLFALTFMTRDTAKTVTAGIASLSGMSTYQPPWGAISASVVLSTLPLILLVVIFQRRIVQGLTAGAAKG